MVQFDMSKSTITNIGTANEFGVDAVALDHDTNSPTVWEFDEATTRIGYYKKIPEFKKALDALATWTTGKGATVESTRTELQLQNLTGWGEDTFQSLMWNMIVMKKIIGDSFAEIVRDDENQIINLKPISAERVRIVMKGNGTIERYDVRKSDGEFTPIKTQNMFHLCNDRIADEIHGTSVLEACQWVIDARNEALHDARKVFHRNVVPLRIIEYEGTDTKKRDDLILQYEEAIKKGEILVVPKGVVTVTDVSITIQDPIQWIRYLENFFYQAVGVPKIILGGADEHTEAGGKVGYITFEPNYVQEQTQLESDLWAQLAIKVKFNRPASLGGLVQQDEAKNTGQVALQPNDAEASITTE